MLAVFIADNKTRRVGESTAGLFLLSTDITRCHLLTLVSTKHTLRVQTPRPRLTARRGFVFPVPCGTLHGTMPGTAKLFIDGQNFLEKLKDVFQYERKKLPLWSHYDFRALFENALQNVPVREKVIYFAKISEHPETIEKSRQLITERRALKSQLERQEFRFVYAGYVRGNYTKNDRGKLVLTFKEKGVDVAIAVHVVSEACGGTLTTAVLCSSDSDLQPAVRELRRRNIEVIYLGFELQPNKGLTYTTTRTILIRNAEVLAAAQRTTG